MHCTLYDCCAPIASVSVWIQQSLNQICYIFVKILRFQAYRKYKCTKVTQKCRENVLQFSSNISFLGECLPPVITFLPSLFYGLCMWSYFTASLIFVSECMWSEKLEIAEFLWKHCTCTVYCSTVGLWHLLFKFEYILLSTVITSAFFCGTLSHINKTEVTQNTVEQFLNIFIFLSL